ncbi:MAG TPA: hypothetical protein VLC92_00345 [Rhodocyclaceae bacterium]|nr:hypothetical protein [Rhodocyclaceae bacterium]
MNDITNSPQGGIHTEEGFRSTTTRQTGIPGSASTPLTNADGMPISRAWLQAEHDKQVDSFMEASLDSATGTARFVGGVSAESHPAEWLAQHGIQAISDRTGEAVVPSPAQARMLVQAFLRNAAMNDGYEGSGMSFSANDQSLPPHLARVRGRQFA